MPYPVAAARGGHAPYPADLTRPANSLAAHLLTNLAAYWDFAEASGNRIDEVGGLVLAPQASPEVVTGLVGDGVHCTTADHDFFSAADAAALRVGDNWVTYACWVKPDADGTNIVIMGKRAELRLYRYTDNCLYTEGPARYYYSTVQLLAGAWHLAFAFYDKLTGNHYIALDNGTLKGPGATPETIPIAETSNVFEACGSYWGGYFANAIFDEMGIWKGKILRPMERLALYNGGSGVTYPFSAASAPRTFLIDPTDMWDSENRQDDKGLYHEFAPFSRVRFLTSATSLDVYVFNNINASYPTYDHVIVNVDGVYQEALNPTATGESKFTVSLAAGTKTVELVNSLQSTAGGTYIRGTWVRDVQFADGSAELLLPQVVSNRLLAYGDSITAGGNATEPGTESWPVLLRADLPVVVEAYGYRSLYDDCSTAGKRAALVARIMAANPATIWLAIGTNDYGLAKWSAADFETAYEALLTDLAAALPSAAIYCQCPIDRDTETANAFGDTLGAYRTAISDAVTATGIGTYIDATGWFAYPTGYSDGTHPNTAGHATYYAAVKAALGL